MRKILSLMVVMLFLLVGCSKAGETPEAEVSQNLGPKPAYQTITLVDAKDPVDWVLCIPEEVAVSQRQFSKERFEQVNELLSTKGLPELRVTLVGNYDSLNARLLNAISEELGKNWDLLYFEEEAFGNAGFEQLFDTLDNELEEGGLLQEAYALLPKEAWERGRINGNTYSVAELPTAVSMGIQISPWYLERLQLTADDFEGQDPWNMDALLQKIKEQTEEKPFIKLLPPRSISNLDMRGWNTLAGLNLSSQFHMICPFVGIEIQKEGQAVNILDSAAFEEALENMNQYINQGYAAEFREIVEKISGKSFSEYMSQPDLDLVFLQMFSLQSVYGAGVTQLPSEMKDLEGLYQIPMGQSPYIMQEYAQPCTVLSKISDNREAALKVLNFVLTDAKAQELMLFGETPEQSEGVISAVYSWHGLATAPILNPTGETLSLYPHKKGEDTYQAMQAMYAEVEPASCLGFIFDPSPVREQIEKVTEISQTAMSTNFEQWQASLPALRDQLAAAGIQEIVDEVNRQLAEFK